MHVFIVFVDLLAKAPFFVFFDPPEGVLRQAAQKILLRQFQANSGSAIYRMPDHQIVWFAISPTAFTLGISISLKVFGGPRAGSVDWFRAPGRGPEIIAI